MNNKYLYLHIPKDWICKKLKGPGIFATYAELIKPDGHIFIWTSRYYRKHHFKLDISLGSTWWATGSIGWWIGILFAIGASLFALGSIPSYAHAVGNTYDAFTFFMGSIFFTSASFLQYLESANAPRNISDSIHEKLHFLTWEPLRIDWWATMVQFIGTLFFNISTFYAIKIFLSVSQKNQMVWTPDVFGSICFLIASVLAWWEVSHGFWSWQPRDISWWIGVLNLLGSVAFGISASAAYVLPATGLPKNEIMVNAGTFVGAVCFLIGGLLLLPERTLEKKNNLKVN